MVAPSHGTSWNGRRQSRQDRKIQGSLYDKTTNHMDSCKPDRLSLHNCLCSKQKHEPRDNCLGIIDSIERAIVLELEWGERENYLRSRHQISKVSCLFICSNSHCSNTILYFQLVDFQSYLYCYSSFAIVFIF